MLHIVKAADLRPVHNSNHLVKFADDTYLIVPWKNTELCAEEIAHIQDTYTHTHNRFTAVLEFVRDYPGEQCFDAVGWASGRASGL